jgi:glutaredoxin
VKVSVAHAGAVALGVAVLILVAARRQAEVWRAAGGPPRVPVAWSSETPARVAWVFTRRGCPHCAAHLAALDQAVDELPPALRAEVLAHIAISGMTAARRDVHRLPDSIATTFDVRIAPTTWWIESDGSVRRAWRGARGVAAWKGGLDFLAGRSAGVQAP